MGKRIFVGNLPFGADDAKLNELFSQHGEVTIKDPGIIFPCFLMVRCSPLTTLKYLHDTYHAIYNSHLDSILE